VYGCFFDDTTGVRNRDSIGVSQLLFEVDYPHQDTTWPHTDKVIARIAEQVPEPELHAILRGNAMELFGLGPLPTPLTA
ncbi:MAG TPA: amidohydrolase family protein, partial [Acidimicrobiales bacterium]|nr:amidohydrolase family protein [Acidimicrobiales bacterium]